MKNFVQLVAVTLSVISFGALAQFNDPTLLPSPAKRVAAENLLKQERIILSSKAVDGGEYTVYLYPKTDEVKVNLSKNTCFPMTLPAKFSINEADNIAVRVVGLSKQVYSCPAVHYNIDPVTGVAGEFTYYESTRKWSTSSNRFYLREQ